MILAAGHPPSDHRSARGGRTDAVITADVQSDVYGETTAECRDGGGGSGGWGGGRGAPGRSDDRYGHYRGQRRAAGTSKGLHGRATRFI